MKEALFYSKINGQSVRCYLCAHNCLIKKDKKGICGTRQNIDGVLYSIVYGNLVASNIDPIEKKPLYHFFPGTLSFSISTRGCNFKCKHCQNASISQFVEMQTRQINPLQIVEDALNSGCKSISYTYTEPTVYFEYAFDIAKIAKQKGLLNIFVSNGYISKEASEAIIPYLNANNIDLKGDDEFYKSICGARLQPVLDTIKRMKDSNVWIEITTLIIPTLNDNDDFLIWAAEFIKSVDPTIPWHLSAFYPAYKMNDKPPTTLSTLKRAREIALKTGLKYVYIGNIQDNEGANTYCPQCKTLLIKRQGYTVRLKNLNADSCSICGYKVEGRFILS